MKIPVVLLLASVGVSALGMPLYEPFNYTTTSNLVGNISPDGITWAQAGPVTGTNQPVIAAGNLSYPGLAPSTGKSVTFGADKASMAARYSLPSTVASGTLYYSFLMQLSDLTGLTSGGAFWAGFNNSSGSQATVPGVLGARILTRSSGSGFNIGLSKSSSTASDFAWDTTVHTANETILVVAAYQIVNGINGSDDISMMWIDPDSSAFNSANPPTPTLTATTGPDITSTANPPGIGSFALFSRNSAAVPKTTILDELLISTNWAGVTPTNPVITVQPQSQRVLVGSSATFNVSAYKVAGYQWQYNGANIAGATGASYTLSNAQAGNGGSYTVVATNGPTSATSSVAVLTVVPDSFPRLRPLWNIPPNTPGYPYVTTDDSNTPNLRSIAYNPLSNQLLVASRTNYTTGSTAPMIYVLDAATGANLYTLDTSVIGGGDLSLTCIDVADDGSVYAVNLASASGTAFEIYRWPDSTSGQFGTNVLTANSLAGGHANGNAPRWGDAMRVRGSGTSTEIIADSNDGNWFAVFAPVDSTMSSFQLAGNSIYTNYFGTGTIGRSLQFGNTNSFYAKRKGGSLQLASYPPSMADLFAWTNVVVITNFNNFPASVGPIAFPLASNLTCGIDFVSSSSTPDTLDLFETSDMTQPMLLGQYSFPTNHQANGNFIGQVLLAGTNVIALDANNGIAAFTWVPFTPAAPTLSIGLSGSNVIISWPTNSTGFTLYSSPAVAPTSWTSAGAGTIVGSNYQVTSSVSAAPKFYRLQK